MTEMDRGLFFPGSINLRDLGGYRSETGKTVAWRQLLRSGYLTHLDETGYQHLRDLGISQLHDFRGLAEQQQYPDQLHEVTHFADYQLSLGAFSRFFEMAVAGAVTAAKAQHLMEQDYAMSVESCSQEFSKFLRTVAYSGKPVLFHCMAGKDRTGLAAAILLMALGVSDEQIIDDYLLTQEYGDAERIGQNINGIFERHGVANVDAGAIDAFCTVRESYIVSFLQQRQARFGSAQQYLQRGLGMTDMEIEKLRTAYLLEA